MLTQECHPADHYRPVGTQWSGERGGARVDITGFQISIFKVKTNLGAGEKQVRDVLRCL